MIPRLERSAWATGRDRKANLVFPAFQPQAIPLNAPGFQKRGTDHLLTCSSPYYTERQLIFPGQSRNTGAQRIQS